MASSGLKITSVRLLNLRVVEEIGALEPAWDLGGQMQFRRGGGSVTEILTDGGVTGIGPGFNPALLGAINHHLVGQDPFDTERLSGVLRYYAHGAAYQGAAGVDIALWDIIGKACNQPLNKLMGGGRARVPAYASMVRLSTPEERAELAGRLASQGWQAIKLRLHHPTMHEDLRTVELVRRAIGDQMVVMVDANQAQSAGNWQPGLIWDYRRALETARALDALGCYWLEEPLPRYAYKDLARINAAVAMPIAGGENNRGIHEFVQMLEMNVYDILQPESMVNVGITDLRKIGVLGEAYGKMVVPHHGGRSLGTIAHLHLVASWSHSPYLEVLHDPPIGDYTYGFSIFTEPPVIDADGCIAVPDRPGLGVEIDRSLVAEVLAV